MSSSSDFLYIFLHIPKCGGTTFSEHLKYNFRRRALLSIGPSRNRMFQEKGEVDDYIRSLPTASRDEVRVVHGHSVYYGIHDHFSRPARYITFLRDPVDQAISHYNYYIEHYDALVTDRPPGRFPQDKAELSFSSWQQLFDVNMQIPTILNYAINGRIGVNGDETITEGHLERAKKVLDHFYFVGLMSSFDEDSCFLYDELGIRRFLREPQNVTPRMHLRVDEELRESIRKAVDLDRRLYDYGAGLNQEFKARRKDVPEIVDRVRRRRRFVVPFRSIAKDWIGSSFGIGAVMNLQKIYARVRDRILGRG